VLVFEVIAPLNEKVGVPAKDKQEVHVVPFRFKVVPSIVKNVHDFNQGQCSHCSSASPKAWFHYPIIRKEDAC
jgi:hypothetical protein